MKNKPASLFSSPVFWGWVIVLGILVVVLGFPVIASLSMDYNESKGPFKNWTQVVDLDEDGDLDVLISHTRWERVDESWAGVGRWVNQGGGKFELVREQGTEYFSGFAGGAGDVDQDGDEDVFVQNFNIRLLQNRGGLQGGTSGQFLSSGGVDSPPAYDQGYRDMGGTILTGDLNGDGWVDAFITGCCYGLNARRPRNEIPNAPAVTWIWINDGREKFTEAGHILPMDTLDGRPIRQAALGDLDGDGDLDVFAALARPTMGATGSLGSLILLNDGSGQLKAMEQALGGMEGTSVALGDVNADGRLDALVGTNKDASLWINQTSQGQGELPVFVQAEGSFQADLTTWGKIEAGFSSALEKLFGITLPSNPLRTKSVFLSDFDQDGDQDALIARPGQAEIWWNLGQGEFRRSGLKFNYTEDTGLAVGDFDGDGDPDLFAAGNGDGYQIWWNDGKGGFYAGA